MMCLRTSRLRAGRPSDAGGLGPAGAPASRRKPPLRPAPPAETDAENPRM